MYETSKIRWLVTQKVWKTNYESKTEEYGVVKDL